MLKCFWSSMNAIVATTEAGFPPVATLQAAWDKYQDAVDVADMYDGAGSSTGDVSTQNVYVVFKNEVFTQSRNKVSLTATILLVLAIIEQEVAS